jgi:hypothetical protein
MTDEIAAANAVLKLGSAAIAAVTVSIIDCCRASRPIPGLSGNTVDALCCRYMASCDGAANGIVGGCCWTDGMRCGMPFAPAGGCVRSRVMVGNGAEAESVATVEA